MIITYIKYENCLPPTLGSLEEVHKVTIGCGVGGGTITPPSDIVPYPPSPMWAAHLLSEGRIFLPLRPNPQSVSQSQETFDVSEGVYYSCYFSKTKQLGTTPNAMHNI